MFAIIETGSKQYKVKEGSIIDVEKLDVETNTTFDFDNVLLIADGDSIKVGKPYVDNAKVTVSVLNHDKDKKKIVFKFKRKTGYKRKRGHRQPFTTLRVESIKG